MPAGRKVWDAANSLFYERGIGAVGVAEVAASSGVANQVCIRNFESKDGLVVAYPDEHSDSDLYVVTYGSGLASKDLSFAVAVTIRRASRGRTLKTRPTTKLLGTT